jgi:uroporphyrinogen decarboxylase
MTSKERVRAAIKHEPVDQVPLGFYIADYDTIEKVIGRKTFVRDKIRSTLALWEGRRDEVVESYKKDTVEFYQKIGLCDIVCFKECPVVPPKDYEPTPPKKIDDSTWQTPNGRVWRAAWDSNMLTEIHDPDDAGMEEFTIEMFEDRTPMEEPDASCFECVDYVVEHLGPDHYILGHAGPLTSLTLLGGMAQGCLEYALHPEVVRAATAQALHRDNQADAWKIRPGQDGVLFERDMASSKGPMISPSMFREFCYDAMAERVGRVKERGMQIALHNCGNNRAIMDQIIDAGIECYQSLQTDADMAIDLVKPAYGNRIAFWGGISLERLVLGTPDDARADVRNSLQVGAPGSGFILGPSHSIAFDTKYDNFMAMLDEYDKLKSKYC